MFLYPLTIYKTHTYEDPKISALIRNAAEDAYEIGLNRGRIGLVNNLLERLEHEMRGYSHPYTTYENAPGYLSVIEMLLAELEDGN